MKLVTVNSKRVLPFKFHDCNGLIMRVLAAWTFRIEASQFHRSPPFRAFYKTAFNAEIW